MSIIKKFFDKKGMPILSSVFLILFIAEGRYRLRKRTQPRIQRAITNSLVSIPSFSLLRFLFLPVVIWVAQRNRQYKVGLNHHYNASLAIKGAVAFLILDYTNYLWHVINHKLPFLWRFHVVHHSDHDLDITTAFRFHFGELIGSVFYRGFFILLSGATPKQVLTYEILFEAATQFHHSNTSLPLQLEESLSKVIVTPRMHGIHHSNIKTETDSNYSVIFSFWDKLHKTFQINIPQEKITIGVPVYNDAKELTVGYLLKLPFLKQRDWPKEFEQRH